MKKRNSITIVVLDFACEQVFIRASAQTRHIIFPLTPLLLEKFKLMIIDPDNPLYILQAVPMSKQLNRVNIEPEILHGNYSSYGKYNEV